MQNAKCKMFFSSGLADPGEMWYNNLIAEHIKAALVKGRGTASAVEGFAAHGTNSPQCNANTKRITANSPPKSAVHFCAAPFDKGAFM